MGGANGLPVCPSHFLHTCFSHRLINHAADGVRRLPLHPLGGVGVGVQGEARAVVTQGIGQGFHVHTVLQGQRGEGVPLWHNKDKSKNPCGARVTPHSDTK